MKISVIAVGNIKDKFFKEAIDEYTKRVSRFCDMEIIETPQEKIPDNAGDAIEKQIKSKEITHVRKRINPSSTVIALDLKGSKLDSVEFAQKLDGYMTAGSSHLTFIIGGSLGIDNTFLKNETHLRFSMSDLTFTHRLARLILAEQLYRAFKIIKGETYHK